MVKDVLPSLAAGRRVVSTVKILGADGEPHPLWVPLQDFRTLLDVEACDVLLDEVTGVASSRSAGNVIPPAVLNLLMQLRRRDVTLSLTAPAWNRAEKVIRETCQAVTLCQGFAPQTVRSVQVHYEGRHAYPWAVGTPAESDPLLMCPDDKPHVHDDARLWRPKRLFFWRTYDAFVFDEWTTSKRERIRPVARELFWRPGSEAERRYDTLDQVLSVRAVTDAGACVDCGGTRTRPKCHCPEPEAVVVEETSVAGAPLEVVPVEASSTPRKRAPRAPRVRVSA